MARQVLRNASTVLPMQAPFSRYCRSTGRPKHCAFQATPALDAVHVSRIRQWYPWWDMGYIGLLAQVGDLQPKLSWIKQPALPLQHGGEPDTAARTFRLMVEAWDSSYTPCYDSDTEEGRWEMDTSGGGPKQFASPHVAIIDPATTYAGFIHDHKNGTDGFSGNCCHVFEASGKSYLLCGSSRQLNCCLTQRLRVYCLDNLDMLEPRTVLNPVDNSKDYNGQYPEFDIPPILQQEVNWQAGAESASMAGDSSRVAWQTGATSFRVLDILSLMPIAQGDVGSMVAKGSQIISLQWSSCGNYLAILCGSVTGRHILLWETQGWQEIWDAEQQGNDAKMSWAPTKPSLAILDGDLVQVVHVTGASVASAQQSINDGSTSGRTCRWDPSSRYLVVLSMWSGREMGQAAILDALTARQLFSCQIQARHWPEWLEPGPLLGKGPIDCTRPTLDDDQAPLRSLQQCFVHEPAGLVTMSRQGASWKGCGARWSHISPDGAFITTLLASIPGDATYPYSRAVYAFQHHHTAPDKHTSMLLFPADMAAGAEEPETKPHPFLCAWLPGTAIYAAAALGFVVVVDGELNKIIKMWPADEFEMREEDWQQRTRLATSYPEEGVTGLSWSPDGLSLAWLHDSVLYIITFDVLDD